MDYLRIASLALNQEVAELIDSFPWKPWKEPKYQIHDRSNAAMEIIDCIFFLVSVAEAANISFGNLESIFKYKLKENYDRIERGYNNKSEER